MVSQHNYTPEEMREIGERAARAMQEFNEAIWRCWGSMSTEQQIAFQKKHRGDMPTRSDPNYPGWLT